MQPNRRPFPQNHEVLFAKDLHLLLGRSLKTCRRMIRDIRAHFGLPPAHFVSRYHFTTYTGVRLDRPSGEHP